jgi:outer membrane protein TolC
MQTFKFNKLTLLTLFFVGAWFSDVSAQAEAGKFSLKEAISYGLDNHNSIQKSEMEIIKTKQRVNEALAAYLPQLNGSVGFTDNLVLPTSILPGAIFGQPGQDVAVQFGTQFNLNAVFDASQLIYNQTLITSLKALKEANSVVALNKQKVQEQVANDIAAAYYAAQLSTIQKGIIDANLQKLDSLLIIVKSQLDNGFAKKIDFNRLQVTHTNLKSDLQNIELGYQMQLTVLKYFMSYPLDSAIVLTTDIAKDVENDVENYNNLINSRDIISTDLKMLQAQRRLTEINIEQVNAGYFPTLSFNFRYGYQAQQNEINFFNKDANWFAFSSIGLNLQVPIFDGLNKKYKVDQLRIQLKQSSIDEDNLSEALKMQLINAQSKVALNKINVEQQKNNIAMADEIYETTRIQFREGFAPMTDLLNAETAVREAQTNYLRALAQVKLAELEVIKVSGNISSISK